MTDMPQRAGGGYLRFLAWVVGVTVLLTAVGFVPTRHLAGPGSMPALLAGCLIGAIGSALGGVVIALRHNAAPADRVNAVLFAMLVRLAVVVVLGAAVALSGWFKAVEMKALLLDRDQPHGAAGGRHPVRGGRDKRET